ncbi:hypothetical protein EDC04DRAFT_2600336 [Pisolithus marmoratus]|nr:hypothetical protein EDC04DRAFT_2600336 [Pisolithus marmoratus]
MGVAVNRVCLSCLCVLPGATCPAQHGDTTPPNATWFPWPDKKMHNFKSSSGDFLSLMSITSPPLGYSKILTVLSSLSMVSHQSTIKVLLGHVYHVNHLPSIITQGMQDFYVFEPMKLMDGTVIVPEHWYTKLSTPGSPCSDFEYWGHMWRAHPVVSDHTCGYVIHMYETMEVWMDGQPDPCNIIGLIKTRGCSVLPWTFTNPAISNRWHMLAWGHCILSYMIWLYCDDTSSNTSKKWNKHNSFLFTAARLPHVMSSLHGIWAWDIEAGEMALIIPAILVMLGDNPMQSKLACHVGLQEMSCISQNARAAALRQCKILWIEQDTFLDMFHKVTSSKGKTQYIKMKMDTGIKDTYMDVFVKCILKHVKGICAGLDRYTEAVSMITEGQLVEQFMSPVWRIKGLNPHQDTPVEILHVILLGFLKYFWCDAISRLNNAQKVELQASQFLELSIFIREEPGHWRSLHAYLAASNWLQAFEWTGQNHGTFSEHAECCGDGIKGIKGRFQLSVDQVVLIIAKDLVMQVGWTNYKGLHYDVKEWLKSHADVLGFQNVFSNPANEHVLHTVIRRECSAA